MKLKKLTGILKTTAKYIIIAVLWLVIWQAAHAAVGSSLLLPSPLETLKALVSLAESGELWRPVFSSLLRVAAGFLIGMAAGCFLALITAASPVIKDFLQPLMVITKTTPVASFIILAIVWLRSGNVPSFTVSLIVAPIFWSNVYTGITTADPKLVEMAHMYRFSRKVLLTKLYVPTVMPYFYSAVTVGIGMAWKAGIAAEVICRPDSSVGKGLYETKMYFESDKMFAWTVTVIILSLLLEKAAVSILDRTVGRRIALDKAD